MAAIAEVPQDHDVGSDEWSCILDEIFHFTRQYLVVDDACLDAMILYAAATHVIRLCATFPRLLFTSELPESAKTLAMNITVCYSSRGMDCEGTGFDISSGLYEAHCTPEKPVPTLYLDEVSDLFGQSGMGGGRNLVGTVLRKGYKRGATRARSVRGVRMPYSIFTPFIMTGLRTAVPPDIRTRCIVIPMRPGLPREYFDARDAEPSAELYGMALAKAVREHSEEIAEFRVRTLHIEKLTGRRAEVWEPLLACALALGGKRWLNRGLRSFRTLALSEISEAQLTPRQKVLRAIAEMAPQLAIGEFVPGKALADELRRLDEPMFRGRSEASAAKIIADNMPGNTHQRRLPSGAQLRGYLLEDILRAWELVRPQDPDDLEPEEEENPFDVTDEEDEDVPLLPATGATGATGTPRASVHAPAQRHSASHAKAHAPVNGSQQPDS